MSQQVVLLRLFPGLQVETIANFFSEPIQGVVLHSFGAGNAPTKPELLDVFARATRERDIVIVNISQCIRGEVSAIYQVCRNSNAIIAGCPEILTLTWLSYIFYPCTGGQAATESWCRGGWRHDTRVRTDKAQLPADKRGPQSARCAQPDGQKFAG